MNLNSLLKHNFELINYDTAKINKFKCIPQFQKYNLILKQHIHSASAPTMHQQPKRALDEHTINNVSPIASSKEHTLVTNPTEAKAEGGAI